MIRPHIIQSISQSIISHRQRLDATRHVPASRAAPRSRIISIVRGSCCCLRGCGRARIHSFNVSVATPSCLRATHAALLTD